MADFTSQARDPFVDITTNSIWGDGSEDPSAQVLIRETTGPWLYADESPIPTTARDHCQE